MSASRARPIRATDMRQLNRQSDIIAIGVIQVLAMERESEVRP